MVITPQGSLYIVEHFYWIRYLLAWHRAALDGYSIIVSRGINNLLFRKIVRLTRTGVKIAILSYGVWTAEYWNNWWSERSKLYIWGNLDQSALYCIHMYIMCPMVNPIIWEDKGRIRFCGVLNTLWLHKKRLLINSRF